MKHRLSDGAGGLIIDHTNSPGITPADVAHVPGAIVVGEGQKLEVEIWTCSHCERGVLPNPLRQRPRSVCLYCYHYICGHCEVIMRATGQCTPMQRTLDRAQAILEKHAGQPDHPELAKATDLDTLTHEPAAPRIVLTDAP